MMKKDYFKQKLLLWSQVPFKEILRNLIKDLYERTASSWKHSSNKYSMLKYIEEKTNQTLRKQSI